MLVKAKWNCKDGNGWHAAGEVFHTESELGDAVIRLDVPEKPRKAVEKAPVADPVKEEQAEVKTTAEPEKKRSTARRKTGSK